MAEIKQIKVGETTYDIGVNSHTHAAGDISSGTIAAARLPAATTSVLGAVKVGTGLSVSSGTISNSGVRSVATGTSNGTIRVNTNGTATDVEIKGLDNSAFNAAYSKYCLHDLFAFCRMITPTFESTTNGSTWAAQTLNKKIFIQKEIGTGSQLFGNSTLAYRWTWTGSGFSYSAAKYLVLKSTYNNPGLKVTIKVE